MIDLTCIDSAINGRFYKDDEDHCYPSVTTKLGKVTPTGEGLLRWYAKQNSFQDARDYMEQRGSEGTRVHESCDQLLHGESINTEGFKDNTIKRIQGFIKFCKKYHPKVYNTEFVVRSTRWEYAGRVDLLLNIPDDDNKFSIVDIKTSKGIYKKHKLQLMFYKYALNEMRIVNSDDCSLYILLLKHRTKKGYQLKEIPYYPELVELKNKEYNHQLYSNCDMKPKFKTPLPEELQLPEEEPLI